MIVLDGSWFCGGNRSRGIGRYLDAFLRKYFPDAEQNFLWIFPAYASEAERQTCTRMYGGLGLMAPTQRDLVQQQIWWRSLVEEHSIQTVWVLSPFERPWSLLDLGEALFEHSYVVQAIVFDLLPLQYPRVILETWPEKDQVIYRNRLEQLTQVVKIHTISPQVKTHVETLLQVRSQKISVLSFGLTPDWLEVPRTISENIQASTQSLAMTISGGEWRKNLPATLEYFVQNFSKKYHLVVICKLSWKERLRFIMTAWKLGAGTRIHFVGEVSEEEKWRYLFTAQAGLFLSRAEGLGIPLLEYTRAAIPQIIVSESLAEQGFGKLLPKHHIVAADI